MSRLHSDPQAVVAKFIAYREAISTYRPAHDLVGYPEVHLAYIEQASILVARYRSGDEDLNLAEADRWRRAQDVIDPLAKAEAAEAARIAEIDRRVEERVAVVLAAAGIEVCNGLAIIMRGAE